MDTTQLAQTPHAVQPGDERIAACRRGQEMRAVFRRGRERELSTLAHPQVLMMQELGQCFRGTVVKAFCEQGLHLLDHRLGGLAWIVEHEDRPEVVGIPAAGEVAHVDFAVVPELDVGVEESADEGLIARHLETSPFGLISKPITSLPPPR